MMSIKKTKTKKYSDANDSTSNHRNQNSIQKITDLGKHRFKDIVGWKISMTPAGKPQTRTDGKQRASSNLWRKSGSHAYSIGTKPIEDLNDK